MGPWGAPPVPEACPSRGLQTRARTGPKKGPQIKNL